MLLSIISIFLKEHLEFATNPCKFFVYICTPEGIWGLDNMGQAFFFFQCDFDFKYHNQFGFLSKKINIENVKSSCQFLQGRAGKDHQI